MKLIELKNISKSFENLKVLDNVSFELSKGKSLAIVGPSGVGKSTLLRIIAGLDLPDKGEVIVNTKNISMVFQYSALLNSYTVGENIALALNGNSFGKSNKKNKALDYLREVGLEKYVDYFPDQLSGGQRKRVGFARAIASSPEIILYDEPTSGLDPILSTLIEDYMNKLTRDFKVANIIVTHQLSTIKRTASIVIMLFDRKIVWCGTPDEFLVSTNPHVKQFVNGSVEGPILASLLE